jgi:AraC-like DNA-binding protein
MKSSDQAQSASDLRVSIREPTLLQLAHARFHDKLGQRIRSIQLKSGERIDLHEQVSPRLVWAHTGAARIETVNYEYLLGPTQAMWLGASLKHRVCVLQPLQQVELRILVLPLECGMAQRSSALLCVSPLLRALIDALYPEPWSIPASTPPNRERWIASLIADEAERMTASRWCIKLPSSERLTKFCETVRTKPENLRKVVHLSAPSTGMSLRNRSRIFAQELGLTWKDWSQSVVMSHASALLLAGLPVSRVAALCGYSVSAFSSMFSSAQGVAPLAFSRASSGPRTIREPRASSERAGLG